MLPTFYFFRSTCLVVFAYIWLAYVYTLVPSLIIPHYPSLGASTHGEAVNSQQYNSQVIFTSSNIQFCAGLKSTKGYQGYHIIVAIWLQLTHKHTLISSTGILRLVPDDILLSLFLNSNATSVLRFGLVIITDLKTLVFLLVLLDVQASARSVFDKVSLGVLALLCDRRKESLFCALLGTHWGHRWLSTWDACAPFSGVPSSNHAPWIISFHQTRSVTWVYPTALLRPLVLQHCSPSKSISASS